MDIATAIGIEIGKPGIGTSMHFIPLHLHPYYRYRYRFTPESFPRALAAYREALSLSLHTRMSEADVDYVVASVREILES